MRKLHFIYLYIFLSTSTLCSQTFKSYLDSALEISKQGDYTAAIDLCTKAIAMEKDSTRAYFYRAGFHVAMVKKENASEDYQHYKSAIADYSKVLELDPTNAEALFYRGGAHSGMGVLESAKEDYIASLSIDANQAPVHNSLAVIYARKRDRLKALEHIDKAVTLDPNYAKAYSNKGNIHSMMAQHEQACENWKKAIDLGYSGGQSRYERMCK